MDLCWFPTISHIKIWKHPIERTIYFGLSPLPVTVTTRIITFLVGDPNLNLHLPQLLGGGTTQHLLFTNGWIKLRFQVWMVQAAGLDGQTLQSQSRSQIQSVAQCFPRHFFGGTWNAFIYYTPPKNFIHVTCKCPPLEKETHLQTINLWVPC